MISCSRSIGQINRASSSIYLCFVTMEMHIAALASLQANYSNNLAIYKRGREFELKPAE